MYYYSIILRILYIFQLVFNQDVILVVKITIISVRIWQLFYLFIYIYIYKCVCGLGGVNADLMVERLYVLSLFTYFLLYFMYFVKHPSLFLQRLMSPDDGIYLYRNVIASTFVLNKFIIFRFLSQFLSLSLYIYIYIYIVYYINIG